MPSSIDVSRHNGGLTGQLLAFCRSLREAGLEVTPGRVIDAAHSLDYIDVMNRADFRLALRANLISSQKEGAVFDALFEDFWQEATIPDAADYCEPEKERVLGDGGGPVDALTSAIPSEWEPAYSPYEVLSTRDFAAFNDDEVAQMRKLIVQLAPRLATALSRRRQAAASGDEVDFRRSFRRSLRQGGEVLELARRRRRVRKLKLVLLCDVSGSMNPYSLFLVQFIYALSSELRGLDAFVFSTRLTEVTPFLKGRPFEAALEAISDKVADWSGGTSIGGCLHAFNYGPGRSKVTSRTVVVVVSDGWDRGDARLLGEEMRLLKRRSYKIIWLNPLLGNPQYQPLVKGIQAALPYVDYFLPAQNLSHLVKLGETLYNLARS